MHAAMAKQTSDDLIAQKSKRWPGLHALANKLGVSHTAVAMALRDDPRISEGLRKRVKSLAVEEGYVASNVAQSLLSGRTSLVGIVVPSIVSTFMGRLLQGITDGLQKDGCLPLVLCSDLDVQREKDALEAIAGKRADGVIIVPCLEDRGEDHFINLLSQHTPIVAVDHPLPRMDVPLVCSDDDLGAELATRHLIQKGHRRIAHFAAPIDSPSADRRREFAYRRVMEQAGLEPVVIHVLDKKLTVNLINTTLSEFFESAQGKATTAAFVFSDAVAYAIYNYAQDHGLRIGEDLAVVGFGGAPVARLNATVTLDIVRPKLSTVEQHPQQIGLAAVEVLRRLAAGQPVQRQTLIEPHLLEFESSAKQVG
jgi:DNA-binding LacI/PurR family transcriptional regulator